jgi:hypothetical protein
MSHANFCTCEYKDCQYHPTKHNNECTPCIEKNLKNHEIPACFWNKIGEESDIKSEYSIRKFAEKVMACEN